MAAAFEQITRFKPNEEREGIAYVESIKVEGYRVEKSLCVGGHFHVSRYRISAPEGNNHGL